MSPHYIVVEAKHIMSGYMALKAWCFQPIDVVCVLQILIGENTQLYDMYKMYDYEVWGMH